MSKITNKRQCSTLIWLSPNRQFAKKRLDQEIKFTYSYLKGQEDRLIAYQRLLIHVQGKSDLVRPCRRGYDHSREAKVYLKALARLSNFSGDFLRTIEDWKGGTGSARNLFHSLFQHLLADYATPRFFDSVWVENACKDNTERCLQHIGIAQGKSLFSMSSPVNMTRRMTHFFLQAPDHFSYIEAMRFGQLKAMGAEDWLLDEVKNTRLGRNIENEAFWESVMRFLVFYQDSGLDQKEVGMIIDFLQYIKYYREEMQTENGLAFYPPRDPFFSLKGRNLHSLMKLVYAWHGHIQGETNGRNRHWRKSSFGEFNLSLKNRNPENPDFHWNICELLDSNALFWEGRELRHCVGLYDRECFRGRTTIWSMARLIEGKRVRVLSIELNPYNRRIMQIRGRCNRMPKRWELEVLHEWANREKIIM